MVRLTARKLDRRFCNMNMVDIHLSKNALERAGHYRFKFFEGKANVSDSKEKSAEQKTDKSVDEDIEWKRKPRNYRAERERARQKKAEAKKKELYERKLELIPRSLKENPIFCILCQKGYPMESHVSEKHADLSREDIKIWKLIGRVTFNRLRSVGCLAEFSNSQNKPKLLYSRIKDLYGERFTERVTSPGKILAGLYKKADECNALIDELDKTGKYSRRCVIPLGSFRVSRLDLERKQNVFCTSCNEFTNDKWARHCRAKHKFMTKLQNRAVLLYSQRVKLSAINRLLALDRTKIAHLNFEDNLRTANYSLEPMSKIPQKGAVIKKICHQIVEIIKVKKSKFTILYKKLRQNYYEGIFNQILVAGFKVVQKKFGRRYTGFYDFHATHNRKLNPKQLLECRRQQVVGVEAINFLQRKSGIADNVFHSALMHYHPFRNQALIYESMIAERRKPMHEDYLRLLAEYHGHMTREVLVGYVNPFAEQDDLWSCSLHAYFACICVMAKKSPSHYKINRFGTFSVLKDAVENGGKALANQSIYDLLARVGEKKRTVVTPTAKMIRVTLSEILADDL